MNVLQFKLEKFNPNVFFIAWNFLPPSPSCPGWFIVMGFPEEVVWPLYFWLFDFVLCSWHLYCSADSLSHTLSDFVAIWGLFFLFYFWSVEHTPVSGVRIVLGSDLNVSRLSRTLSLSGWFRDWPGAWFSYLSATSQSPVGRLGSVSIASRWRFCTEAGSDEFVWMTVGWSVGGGDNNNLITIINTNITDVSYRSSKNRLYFIKRLISEMLF